LEQSAIAIAFGNAIKPVSILSSDARKSDRRETGADSLPMKTSAGKFLGMVNSSFKKR
jgi:hypothetical protein